jgi:hypothetical protein
MRETLQSLVERFQGIRHSWPQAPDAARRQDQVWYTGLAVCPVDFSRQLTDLQLSLQGLPMQRIPAPGASVVAQAADQPNLSGQSAMN